MSLKFVRAFILASLLSASLAAKIDSYHHPVHEQKEPPKPYSFSYGIQNDHTGTIFGQEEQSDGNFVRGSYVVHLPDGRKQTVNYKADHHKGYTADVSYYGEAQYPPESNAPPFVVEPKKYGEEPTKDTPHQPEAV